MTVASIFKLFRRRIMVSILPCHGSDPGSIPGDGAFLFVFFVLRGLPLWWAVRPLSTVKRRTKGSSAKPNSPTHTLPFFPNPSHSRRMGPAAPAAAALHLDRRRRCRCHHRIHAPLPLPLPLPPLPLLLLTTAAILLGRGLLGAHAFGIAPTGTSALPSIRTRAGRTGAAAAASIVAMSAASTKSKSTDERVVV